MDDFCNEDELPFMDNVWASAVGGDVSKDLLLVSFVSLSPAAILLQYFNKGIV